MVSAAESASYARTQSRSRSPSRKVEQVTHPHSSAATSNSNDNLFGFGETKLLGIIGGIFPPSTVEYYEAVNSIVRKRLGGTHDCNVLIWSLDQHPMVQWSTEGIEGWNKIAERLQMAASGLERAGAACIIIACNSVHKVFEKVSRKVGIPILHIADATAQAIQKAQVTSVGLLGTLHTTEDTWFIERLKKFGIEAIVSDEADRKLLDRVIFKELNDGVVREESKAAMQRMILDMKVKGACGVILGCTELRLLVDKDASGNPLPISGLLLFDTGKHHCEASVEFVCR